MAETLCMLPIRLCDDFGTFRSEDFVMYETFNKNNINKTAL